MDRELRRAMRAALASGEADQIAAALVDVEFARCAQQIGNSLITAIQQDDGKLHEIGVRCLVTLRERCWVGDEELAEQFERALGGDVVVAMLGPLQVDLDQVADLLESTRGEVGWIDLETGEVLSPDLLEALDDLGHQGLQRPGFDEEPERRLVVPPSGGRSAYRDMEDFISELDDTHLAEKLEIAIDGPGAFRRFKNVLRTTHDSEDDWYEFSAERRYGRARAWLTQAGYRPEQRIYKSG